MFITRQQSLSRASEHRDAREPHFQSIFQRRCSLLRLLPLVVLIGMGAAAHGQQQWVYNAFDEFNTSTVNGDVNHSIWVGEDGTPQVLYDAPTGSDSVVYCAYGSSNNTCVAGTHNYALDGNGHFVIHALNTNTTRDVNGTQRPVYNSGRISSGNDSAHQLLYGRIEARIQIPKGLGAWPAFWLLGSSYDFAPSNPGTVGWPETGEIDILENWSVNSNLPDLYQNQGSIHGPTASVNPGLKTSYIDQGATATSSVELDGAFHTYAIEWFPGEVDFFIDSVLFGRRSPALLDSGALWEVDAKPLYPILNLAVGTMHNGTDFPGGLDYPTSSTPNTLDMVVDYVRHYTSAVSSRTLPPFYGNADIGGPGPNSAASYSGGTFTITGAGNGIDLTAGSSSYLPNDQLQYVYRALTADGTYSVNVGSQSSTLSTAGAGLMIRDGRAAYAQFVTTWIAEDGTVRFQSRASATATTASYGSCGPWLRIIKSGTSFTGACSTDGTHWTTTGTATVAFSNHMLSGLISFSGGNPIAPTFADTLNTTTFTNLSVPSGEAAWDGNAPVLPLPEYKGTYPVATLVQAENFNVGGQGVAYHTGLSSNLGGQYRPDEDVSILNTYDYTTTGTHGAQVNGYSVGNTHTGQWMDYTINVATAGNYAISTRVASDGAGGIFHYTLDGTSVGGEMTVPDTGDWDTTFQTVTTSSINFSSTGIHTLRLVMDSEGATTGAVGNFDLFTIQ